MTTRDVSNRISHGENRETKSQRNAKQPDSELRERRGQNCASASSKYKPHCPDELGKRSCSKIHLPKIRSAAVPTESVDLQSCRRSSTGLFLAKRRIPVDDDV